MELQRSEIETQHEEKDEEKDAETCVIPASAMPGPARGRRLQEFHRASDQVMEAIQRLIHINYRPGENIEAIGEETRQMVIALLKRHPDFKTSKRRNGHGTR